MKWTFTQGLALVALLWLAAAPAPALALTAASADDICAPAEDPCVIDAIWDVTGSLDFGLRTVSIVTGGRLRGQPGVALAGGAITIDVGDGVIAIDAPGGLAAVSAWRACSGDGTTPCLANSQCSGLGLGTCTAGSAGTIVANGAISVAAAYPGAVYVEAAGDITTNRRISANATSIGVAGGTIRIESFQGSVTAAGQLTATSASGSSYYYSPEGGGEITIEAAVDVTLSAEARVWGADHGGQVDMTAGRDVLMNGDIVSAAGSYSYASGGYVTLNSGRDLKVFDAPGGEAIQEISTDGGGSFKFYGYGSGGYWSSGYGGYQRLRAGKNLWLGSNSNLHARGGPGAKGGYIYLNSYEGETLIEGSVYAQGSPPFNGGDSGSAGGLISVWARDGLTLAPGGQLNVASPMGFGSIQIESDGPMDLDGVIDARGTATADEYWYGSTGYMDIKGNTDVTIRGNLRGASQGGADLDWTIDVCRLHLTADARIDLLHGSNIIHGVTGLQISIGESMVADAGSIIETDPNFGTLTRIYHRSAKKPPVLDGTISPDPSVIVNPSIPGCPVCGNFEIDEGESCDDGNTVSGDGCRSDCQDEGCIAATPGYPAIALCYDGVACTADECNPVTHTCSNPVSCDDSIACTTDSCAAGECLHAAQDPLCDDGNDCTDDLCNEATGCAFAGLTGNACEDGDYCTPPGTCESGDCIAAPSLRSTGNSVKTKVSDGAANDKLKARVEIPLSSFTADADTTGMRVVVSDADDQVVHTADLPAAGWVDRGNLKWTYRTTTASASVKGNLNRDIVRISVKLSGAELAGTLAQEQLSLSVLFGTVPGTDPCLTARDVPCSMRTTTTSCRD